MSDIFDDYRKDMEKALEDETRIHEQYALELLKRHMLEPERHRAAVEESATPMGYLETLGYKLEKWAVDTKVHSEVYEWRLFKLVDTSPKYRIKRVISIEEPKQ